MNSGSNMLNAASVGQGGVKNMRTLQPPQGSSNNATQAKIVNAQHNLVTKSSKGRLSSKLSQQHQHATAGNQIGQNRSSTSTSIENHYMNGRAGANLIGQQQRASTSLEMHQQHPNNISIDVESISLNQPSNQTTNKLLTAEQHPQQQ